MKTNISFRNIINYFSKKSIKNKIDKVDKTVSELIHPRFIVDQSSNNKNAEAKKSMLFQMYSNDNDTLFI